MNVFLILGLAWLAFLAKVASGFIARRSGPTLRGLVSLQRRNDDDLYGPIGTGYGVPRPTALAPQPTPRLRARRAARRRRDVLVGLTGLALLTAVLAIVVGGSLVVRTHLLVDTFLVLYVMALLRRRRSRELAVGSRRYLSDQYADVPLSGGSYDTTDHELGQVGQVLSYPARRDLVYPSSRSQRTG